MNISGDDKHFIRVIWILSNVQLSGKNIRTIYVTHFIWNGHHIVHFKNKLSLNLQSPTLKSCCLFMIHELKNKFPKEIGNIQQLSSFFFSKFLFTSRWKCCTFWSSFKIQHTILMNRDIKKSASQNKICCNHYRPFSSIQP